MKKLLCFIISCSLFVLAACGGEGSKVDNSKDVSKEESYVFLRPSADESYSVSSEETENSTEISDISAEVSSEGKEPTFTSGDFEYTLVNTVAMICSYNGKETELGLPSELDGYTVTAITGNAFANNKTLKKITVSDTIVNIEEGAFNGCTSLEYVYIGSSVAVLQPNSFAECAALKEIEVSSVNKSFSSLDGVLYNGDKSVLLCCPRAVDKEELTLPDAVALIEEDAFSRCAGIKKIKLPKGCQLKARAFFYCMDLEEIELGEGVTEIPEKCFFGCVMLEEIAVPSGVTSIGDYAYFGCISAEKASLPESVEEIGDDVFKSCSALKKIETAGDYLKNWYNETGKDYINT